MPKSERNHELRQHERKMIETGSMQPSDVMLGDAEKLIEELRIRQAELEAQNEELRAAQAAAEESGARYNEEIEKRQELENELRRSNDELQEFAFTASHDLQEPMRKIRAFGNLLQKKSGNLLSEQALDYLSRMIHAAERMSVLINSLLEYSRVSNGKAPFSTTNIAGTVREAVADLEISIAGTGAEVSISPLPAALVDAHQMRRLFMNLISNALKFRRRGITPRVRIYGETCGDRCRIFVQDNGIGFDEKDLSRIFVPFQRLHGHSEYEGTGIGLPICTKIVERHGGTITAESRPQEGSTFIITLPLNSAGNQ